jgi:hypothetical protein
MKRAIPIGFALVIISGVKVYATDLDDIQDSLESIQDRLDNIEGQLEQMQGDQGITHHDSAPNRPYE